MLPSKLSTVFILTRLKPHLCSVAYAGFWKGGARNFRKCEKSKGLNQIVPPKIGPIFRPKLDAEQKKKVFTQIWSDFSPEA